MPMDNRLLVPRYKYDPDAAVYLAAVEAADGQALETPVKRAIDTFFRDTKAAGVFDALEACCILCGARTITGALVPLAGSAPTSNGFVSGDYTRGGATPGLQGDGTSYLDSNYAFPSDLLNDMHISGYVSEQPASLGGFFSSSYVNPGSGMSILLNSAATEANATLSRTPFSGAATISVADANGFIGANRDNASTVDIRAGGTQEEDASASSAVTALNQYVFSRNTIGSPNNFFTGKVAFYSFGASVDLESLDTAVSDLITAIGNAL